MAQAPYDLLIRPDKTTLTVPGGIALGFGPGPGLRHAMFWNRIGSLFSCYRPSVAVATVFSADDLHHPAPVKQEDSRWEPNLCTGSYRADSLHIEERRWALASGLVCEQVLTNTGDAPGSWVIAYHGQVQQWEFFDYARQEREPQVEVCFQPEQQSLLLRQPHPHDGCATVASLQEISIDRELAAYGFAQSESELATLWQEHGCLASLRLRLGQVGGRLMPSQPARFSHRAPLYYFAVRVELAPGESAALTLRTHYHTDDTGGTLADPARTTTPEEWRRYLEQEVPQLESSDEALRRYWYYVWYVLRANRTAPGAHITAAFTAPSKYMYWGPWIWDGYFHALGEMWLSDPAVAADTIRAVLQMQFPNGFIPVCSGSQYRMCFHEDVAGYTAPGGGGYASYVPPELPGYREHAHQFEAEFDYELPQPGLTSIGRRERELPKRPRCMPSPDAPFVMNEKTQTPLITVAAAEYAWLRGGREFAAEVLPALWAYEEWLWRRRTDNQGRFVLWHGDESGWDNATRHYPVPALPFDVQVHCLLHRLALAELAALAGTPQQQIRLAERIELTRAALKTYWDDNDQWHYDFGSKDGGATFERRKQIAPSGLFALLVDDSPPTLEACLNALRHERVFATQFPIPTLAACDPGYAPHGWGWNGPAWLQVNFFTLIGLLDARQYDAAFALWEKTRVLIIGKDGQPASFELYDPELGTGIGCPDYSWQAMINYLIITRFAGVTPGSERLAPALPPGLDHLRLTNLPGMVSSIELERRGKVVQMKVQYTGLHLLNLDSAGLGSVKQAIVEGLYMEIDKDARLTLPASMEARTDWEVSLTCR